jgi:hypothetical protein
MHSPGGIYELEVLENNQSEMYHDATIVTNVFWVVSDSQVPDQLIDIWENLRKVKRIQNAQKTQDREFLSHYGRQSICKKRPSFGTRRDSVFDDGPSVVQIGFLLVAVKMICSGDIHARAHSSVQIYKKHRGWSE